MQRLYSKPKNTYPKPEEFIRAGYVDVLHKTLKKEEDFTLTKEEVASMATLNKDIEVHIECDLSCYSDGYGEVDEIDIYFSYESDEIIPNPRYKVDLKIYEDREEQVKKELIQWEEQERDDREKEKAKRPNKIAMLEEELKKLKELDAKDRE